MNKKLVFLSIIATAFFSFIPGIGMRVEDSYRFFGFPVQWLGYYKEGQFSFEVFGLLFNLIVFYFVFFLILNKLPELLFKK